MFSHFKRFKIKSDFDSRKFNLSINESAASNELFSKANSNAVKQLMFSN